MSNFKVLLLSFLVCLLLGCNKQKTTSTLNTESKVLDTIASIDQTKEILKLSYFVNAKSGLNYRVSPKGKILGKFDLNTKLEVIEYSGIYDSIENENNLLQGQWVGVKQNDKTVYVFDGFLSEFKTEINLTTEKSKVNLQANTVENFNIFSMSNYYENEEKQNGIISLTELYKWSEQEDSLAIENKYLGSEEFEEFHKMNNKYRTRFLKNIGIKETDQVFIYNYPIDSLFIFKVKDLPLIAFLSPYYEGRSASQYDYMIGFGLENKLSINDFKNFYQSLIYIGSDNPFETGMMKAIVWKKIDSSLFPTDKNDFTKNKKYSIGNTYKYIHNNMEYFIQDISIPNEYYGRRLKIFESDSKKILFEKLYYESEGLSLSPLNFVNSDYMDEVNQWTGTLFKNKAPVIFGFQYHSFDCPEIDFINQNESLIRIRCDNRH